MRMRFLPLPLVICLAAGCATAPTLRQFDKQVALQTSDFDKTWNALVDLFGERGWTIANMDKASGFMNSDWMRADRTTYVDCGKPGIAIDSDMQGRFNVIVRKTDPSTTVTVNTTWKAVRSFGSTRSAIECVSTGALEKEIHAELHRRLGVSP